MTTHTQRILTLSEASAIGDKFFGAIEAGDVEGFSAMFSPDLVMWFNGGGSPRRIRDKSSTVNIISWLISVTNDRRYEILDRQPFDGGFFQQHMLTGSTLDGTPFSFRVAVLLRIDADGLINRFDEYLDVPEMGPLQNKDLPRK